MSEPSTPAKDHLDERPDSEPIWKRKIRLIVEEHGGNEAKVSLGAGRSRTWIRDQLQRNSTIRQNSLEGLARFANRPIEWFFSEEDSWRPRVVPVVGHVGAGGEWFMGNGSENGEIPAPEYARPKTVAVKIRGDSMGSFLNGWYALYDDVRDPPTDDLIGRPCIVWTADGKAMVKILRRGTQPGLWTLYSGYGEPIEDAHVVAAAPVIGFELGSRHI
jgi:hypothetical protein